MIKIEHKNITIASTEKFTSLLKGGFIYLSQHKILFAYGLILYIPFIGANIFNIALPGYVSNHLGESSAVFGLIDMFYGIGACIAGLLVITLTKKFSIYKLLQIMFLTGVVCGILFYINDKVVFSIILTLIIGFCGPSIRTIINTIVMEKVPNQILGRVISAWSILSSFIQIVVTFILGKVMDYYGSNWGFLFYSLIMAVALIICYFIKYSLEVQNEKSNNY